MQSHRLSGGVEGRIGAVEMLLKIKDRWPEIFRPGYKPESFRNPDQLSALTWAMTSLGCLCSCHKGCGCC